VEVEGLKSLSKDALIQRMRQMRCSAAEMVGTKQVLLNNINKKVSVQFVIDSRESIQRLLRFGQITVSDSNELSKLTRERLLTLIKNHEYSFINGNIIPENLIIKIVTRLRNQNNPRPIITGIPISSAPSTSPSSISTPSSISSNSVSPNITVTNSSMPALR
jgi:hypothetical protein